MIDRVGRAAQFRRALQMFAASMTDEQAMEVATIFPEWEPERPYKTGQRVSYGENATGDPQLYQVLQDHTSQAYWTPDAVVSLYKPVGVTPSGYPEWSQPVGASDAYNKGDVVSYHEQLFISNVDSNVWAPDVYGWSPYDEG